MASSAPSPLHPHGDQSNVSFVDIDSLIATNTHTEHKAHYAQMLDLPKAIVPSAPMSVPGMTGGQYLATLFASSRCLGPQTAKTLYPAHKMLWENAFCALEVASIPPAAWIKFCTYLWEFTNKSHHMAIPLNYVCSIKVFNKHNMRVFNQLRLNCPPRIVFPPASRACWMQSLEGAIDPDTLLEAVHQADKLQARINARIDAGEYLW